MHAPEAITENRSARLDESDSIQKRKRLENTNEKCAQLLGNAFNATYAVYLLRAHKCRPPLGGVTRGIVGFFSDWREVGRVEAVLRFYLDHNCEKGVLTLRVVSEK